MNLKLIGIIFSIVVLLNIFISMSQIANGPDPTSVESGGLADSPWPMFRQNLNHTGVSPYDTSTNPGKLKWSFSTYGHIRSSPAIDSNGIVYVGSWDNHLYALNSDGSEKWRFRTSATVDSSPAIGIDGTIYVGSGDSYLYAINPNGTEKWSYKTNMIIRSSPAIGRDGTIYIGSEDNNLYAINPNGTKKWDFTTNGWVGSSPAIGLDGTIYIGSDDNRLYALNPDGTLNWNFLTGGSVRSSPVIGMDGTVYVGSHDNKLYAVNSSGIEKWNFTTGNLVESSPAIDSDGTIYVGSYDNKMYAINSNGTEKWHFTTGRNVLSSPAIGLDGIIYIGSKDYKLYAIYPNGTEKWNFITDNYVFSSPSIDFDGTIYIGSHNNNLFAIGNNVTPPLTEAGPNQTLSEGKTVQFNGSNSYDPDGTIEAYEWDFDSTDGLWWETGAPADAIGPTPIHIYGDDGIYVATLRVTDNDNLSATDICNITVLNVDPDIGIESATMQVEIGLRVAGRKFNDVGITLYEDDTSIGYVSIERLPGSPNEQMVWIPMTLDLTKSYSAIVTYIPEDPLDVGANPVWIYIKSENGSINKIHHTFNIQQSKKRDSDHWNHIEPWEVDLNPHLSRLQFEITSHITDPGSDDVTLTYTYGSQIVNVEYMNNPLILDPFPSPEVNPRDIIATTTLIYEGPGTITVIAKDDDNLRLGIGQGSDSIDIV
jgi:outer membrane protein assembly factor BamB